MPNLPKTFRPDWLPKREAFQRRRADNQKFYNSTRWRKTRKIYLMQNPVCVQCQEAGRITAGAVVDHIKPINEGGAELDYDNLQTLCHRCHNIKSGKEAHK